MGARPHQPGRAPPAQQLGACAGGILQESWQAQVLELEARLAASPATWKLVMGHHPIWNNHFNDTEELVAAVQPLLERCTPLQAVLGGWGWHSPPVHVQQRGLVPPPLSWPDAGLAGCRPGRKRWSAWLHG